MWVPTASPADGQHERPRAYAGHLGRRLTMRQGLVGLHLVRHDSPSITLTEEQMIRGNADRFADHVLLACGYGPKDV